MEAFYTAFDDLETREKITLNWLTRLVSSRCSSNQGAQQRRAPLRHSAFPKKAEEILCAS
jgi:hypothetical protein